MNKKEELLIDILKDMQELIHFISRKVPSLQGYSTTIDSLNILYFKTKELEDEYNREDD